MIDELQLYIPRSNDGWFYVKMMSDPETMAYNAPWFPPDGCVPDPDSGWVELQKSWIGKAPERFYAFLQRKTDGAFVGDVNYHHNPKQSWCDMGIVIFAPERGKGMANKDFAYCWIVRLRWTEYPVCTTILRMPALLHIVSTKRLVFGKPEHLTESFI